MDYDAAGTIGINESITTGRTIDIDAAETTTIAEAGDIDAGGAVTFGSDKAGTLTTAANINTTDDNVTFANAVTLSGGDAAVSIDTTGTGAGNILFQSEVLTGGQALTLDAGTAGNITADASITGGGALTVRDGAVQTYKGNIDVGSLEILDATPSVPLGADTSKTVRTCLLYTSPSPRDRG